MDLMTCSEMKEKNNYPYTCSLLNGTLKRKTFRCSHRTSSYFSNCKVTKQIDSSPIDSHFSFKLRCI